MAIGAIGAAAAAAFRAPGAAEPQAGAGDFGGMLRRALEQVVDTGREADAAASAALLGQGGVTEAVLAISRAELALQMAVTIRDRVITAYQDIMRMPV